MLLFLLIGFGFVVCYIHYHVSAVPHLRECPFDEPSKWPAVSVVVPACNEEGSVGEAMQTLLSQDYPDLEIIAINDRSTDSTGEILDGLAKDTPRLKVLHITELPSGWLGKLHALERGTQAAKGEFILFTDADVHFTPGCLRRVMGWVQAESLDHVTLGPLIHTSTLRLNILTSCFGMLMMASTRAARIIAGKADSCIGIGAFNLVRRSVFNATPGWTWLKLEVADDHGLATMMREQSTRTGLAIAEDDVSLTWYHSVREMSRGLQKNAFPVMGRLSPLRTLLLATGCSLAHVALLWGFVTPWWWASLLVLALTVANALALPQMGSSRLAMALAPWGVPFLSYILLTSMVTTLRNKGITWRGTHYDIDELREGQRVKL